MKKHTRNLLSLVLVACLILSLFSSVVAAPSATLIVTTPSGYDSASEVVYTNYGNYIANWGARGEDCGFLSTYAQSFYTGSYKYSTLSKVSGGTSTSNAPSSSLYSSLQTLMTNNHTYFTKYGDSGSSRDCRNLYQYTDCMLGDPSYVSTLYRGYKVPGAWDSGVSYNQEHIWPQSKCIGGSSTDVGDIMQLRAANSSENSSRGNTAYGEGSSYYDPGISVRGDCARTLLYMYVRWGNTDYMWGTDGVMESLDILLKWNKEDPVDTWEMGHNDAVQSITGTRNVFVDYPEYAYLLFGRSIPSDLTTPSTGGDPNANPGGSTGGSGSTGTGTVATLVTNASSLKAGDRIIIAALDYEFAMSTTQNTNNRGQASVTKSGNTLTFGSDVQVITLETGTVSGTFGFQVDGQYLYAASSSANNMKTKATLDGNGSWSVSIDGSTGAATVIANGSYSRNNMRYNASSALFSCYAAGNSQKELAIYRLGTDGGGSGDSGSSGDNSGTTEPGSTATMVTKASSLKAGDRIVIAALDYDFALSTTQSASNRAKAPVTKSGSTLTFGSDVQIITLEAGTSSGTFAFCVGVDAYLYAPSSTANQLKTTDAVEDNGSWTISIDSSTGSASVTAGAVTRNVMRYNSTSSLFNCYAANNTQKNIAIYKLSGTTQCSHSYSSKVTTAATCTSSGVRTYTCTKCYTSYTETIAATGHSYTSKVTAATCTAQGYTTYTCSGCGNSYKDNYTAVAGHSYTSKVTKAATCTASGARTYTCSKCGSSYTETIAATGHKYVNGICSSCGAVDPNCSHSYTSRVTTAATCTTSGIRTYTCSKCGSSYTETIQATGHSYAAKVTAPTCTSQGYTTYTCTSCGNSYKDSYTAAAGHSYSGNSCTVCGAANPSYVANYYLVGYINGADYGCEADWESMGNYQFVNRKLVAYFEQVSYVFVKTEGNAAWYMTQSYCEDTSATFYNTNTGSSEKMFVPGNVEVTFTLRENADGSLTLSYTTSGSAASVKPTLKLKAPTLEFKDMIKVVAFYEATNTQDVEEMGMVTYSSKATAVSVETAEHVIPGAEYDATTGRYFSGSQGIHAKYLGDAVYLAIYAKLKDGTYVYSSQASYSPVQYATTQLKNSTDAKLKQLVAAMLNYGSDAQLYFGHNTSALANASLTAAQKALPAAYDASMGGSVPSASASKQGSFASNKGFASRRPAVSFEGAFSINYFFTPSYVPNSGITLYYWNEADYNAASVLTIANATGSVKMTGTSEYRGDVTGIAAKALSEAVYVAATYESGGITWTSGVLGYSIGAYCTGQASQGGSIAALAKATAVYGYHAKAYFG